MFGHVLLIVTHRSLRHVEGPVRSVHLGLVRLSHEVLRLGQPYRGRFNLFRCPRRRPCALITVQLFAILKAEIGALKPEFGGILLNHRCNRPRRNEA